MMADVTQLLQAIDRGESEASDRLWALVYDEVRRLAAQKLGHEGTPQTLQPTALVHEVWLRLAGVDRQQWKGRKHFFGAVSEIMRRILIEQVRRKAALKRGERAPVCELHESRIELKAPDEQVLAVNEALEGLAEKEPIAAQIVKLRYFVGMSVPEIAEALEMSPRTVDRYWAFARAWLKCAIHDEPIS